MCVLLVDVSHRLLSFLVSPPPPSLPHSLTPSPPPLSLPPSPLPPSLSSPSFPPSPLPPSLPSLQPVCAGVVSLCEDAKFTISVHREDTLADSIARHQSPSASPSLTPTGHSPSVGKTLRTTQAPPTDQPDNGHASLPPGHERCSSCGSVMRSLTLLMHERHCVQSTFKCPLCKYVVKWF